MDETKVETEQPVGAERLGTLHSGQRYILGYGRDFYGVWNQFSPDEAVERFPATAEGRREAWARYLELEPDAATAPIASTFVVEEVVDEAAAARHRRRRMLVIVGAVIVVLIGLFVVLKTTSKKTVAGGGAHGGVGGGVGHVEVSSPAAITEDMSEQEFNAAGLTSLYPHIDATWKGTQVEMKVSVDQPKTGTFPTNENPPVVITFTVTDTAGTPETFKSSHGECQLTIDDFSEDVFKGSFDCTDVPSTGTSGQTLSASGTYEAK